MCKTSSALFGTSFFRAVEFSVRISLAWRGLLADLTNFAFVRPEGGASLLLEIFRTLAMHPLLIFLFQLSQHRADAPFGTAAAEPEA